jgi:hypothetical protein
MYRSPWRHCLYQGLQLIVVCVDLAQVGSRTTRPWGCGLFRRLRLDNHQLNLWFRLSSQLYELWLDQLSEDCAWIIWQ